MQRRLPMSGSRYLLIAWALSTLVLGLLYAAVYVRMRVAQRRWPRTDIHGATVRVAPAAGPAVFGVIHPEIIVPRWLLSRDMNEQRLVVTHESEHVRAGDHLLLAAAGLSVVLMPWNPAVWWMFSRLRLAIELDCDARVLGTGVAPRSYGTLLIDLAERSQGLRLGAPALIDGSSHLHTRVMAMKPQTRKFARVRGSLVGFAAFSLLVMACEAKMPTDQDVAEMDVAAAERAAVAAHIAPNVDYSINGVAATAQQAHALTAQQIASISLERQKTAAAARGIIKIKTKDSTQTLVAMRSDSAAPVGSRIRIRGSSPPFSGLLMVDGVKRDPATMHDLDPKNIESIQVLKGQAALTLYSDSLAVNGVIDIKTKKPE